MEQQDALKEVGVEEVIIYCVNDGAVMMAWAKDQGVTEDGMITLMGDPYGDLTVALQMELTHPGPASVGITGRCKRFALYVQDGIVQIVRVAESENDPAGDEFPDVTLAESMVQAIKEFQAASGSTSSGGGEF
jgi:peroxiredoxin